MSFGIISFNTLTKYTLIFRVTPWFRPNPLQQRKFVLNSFNLYACHRAKNRVLCLPIMPTFRQKNVSWETTLFPSFALCVCVSGWVGGLISVCMNGCKYLYMLIYYSPLYLLGCFMHGYRELYKNRYDASSIIEWKVTHIHTRARVHTHTHTHTRARAHTHTHTHT